jgi:hypothetical protein
MFSPKSKKKLEALTIRSLLNFLIYEENFVFFLISAQCVVFCTCCLFPEALRQESDRFDRCSRNERNFTGNRSLFQEIVGCDGKVKKLKPGECEDICVDQATYTNEYQVYRNKQKKMAKTPYLEFFLPFSVHTICKTLNERGRDNSGKRDAYF